MANVALAFCSGSSMADSLVPYLVSNDPIPNEARLSYNQLDRSDILPRAR